MRRSRRWTEAVAAVIRRRLSVARDDRGSASLEFLTAGVLLLVPLVYLVVMLGAVQAASLGTEGAARQAARLYARAAEAREVAARAVATSLADYGVEPDATALGIVCQPADCTARDGVVTVTVDTVVALPLLPAFLTPELPLGVRVSGSATQPVPRFGDDG